MQYYRICRSAYTRLDGDGARRYGGRWNNPGVAVVYASSSRALAALELLANADRTQLPADLVILTLEAPDDLPATRLSPESLPSGWRSFPAPSACRATGDQWIRAGGSLALFVPSVIIPEEENILLNPAHQRFGEIRLLDERPLSLDRRLQTRG